MAESKKVDFVEPSIIIKSVSNAGIVLVEFSDDFVRPKNITLIYEQIRITMLPEEG